MLYLTFGHELPDGDACEAEHSRAVDPDQPAFDAPIADACPECAHVFSADERATLTAAWDRQLEQDVAAEQERREIRRTRVLAGLAH